LDLFWKGPWPSSVTNISSAAALQRPRKDLEAEQFRSSPAEVRGMCMSQKLLLFHVRDPPSICN